MLDEDGVTGQVAMDDGGVTGMEVARNSEQDTDKERPSATGQQQQQGLRDSISEQLAGSICRGWETWPGPKKKKIK